MASKAVPSGSALTYVTSGCAVVSQDEPSHGPTSCEAYRLERGAAPVFDLSFIKKACCFLPLHPASFGQKPAPFTAKKLFPFHRDTPYLHGWICVIR